MYIHERADWPDFTWDMTKLAELLAKVRHAQGRLLGRMEALGFDLQKEASLQTLTQDVVKTSEIEGETLNTEIVRSSIARKLGINIGGYLPKDRNVEGIVEILLDATHHYNLSLTKTRLYKWHNALFPSSKMGIRSLTVGKYRKGSMQVISGPYGREKVHFEAPQAKRLNKEMTVFLRWFESENKMDPVLKAALAHFWMVTIHPFDDGNGRIARAIADMQLARSDNSSLRFYSMSSQTQRNRNDYYHILEQSQKANMNITRWMEWFLQCLHQAILASETMLSSVFIKARFWEKHAGQSLNDRQRLLINHLLEGFKGKLTSSKWAKIAKCSQDTALRDIHDLLNKNILLKDTAGGRSTSYCLNM